MKKLNIQNRLDIGGIIPRKIDDDFNISDLFLSRDIEAKIKLTQEEAMDCNVQYADGKISWKKDLISEIEFKDTEIALIKKSFDLCIQKKHFTIEMLSTYEMFEVS